LGQRLDAILIHSRNLGRQGQKGKQTQSPTRARLGPDSE
jgi:hypothetical protein